MPPHDPTAVLLLPRENPIIPKVRIIGRWPLSVLLSEPLGEIRVPNNNYFVVLSPGCLVYIEIDSVCLSTDVCVHWKK